MRPTSKALYHPVNNPPYQINYRSKRSGKHITVTKRRVTFLFGFSNADAIASGLTEGECRGQEHEVVLIWSHVSGKRQVFMDGREIHASKAAMGNTKFEHAWGLGCHVLKLVANASPSNDGSRQFDLLLDGMSFFQFRQIYQLGSGVVKSNAVMVRAPSIETVPCSQASSYQEERRGVVVDRMARPPVSELSIDVYEAPLGDFDLLETELPSPSYSSGYQGNLPSLANTTLSSSYDEFSPSNSASYGASQKSFAAISNEILHAYNTESYSAPPAAQDPVNVLPAIMPPPVYQAAQNPVNNSYVQAPPQMNHAPTPAYETAQNPVQNSYLQTAPQMSYAPQDPTNNFAMVPTNVQPSTSYSVDNSSPVPQTQKPAISMYDNFQEQDDIDELTACMNKLVNFDDVSKPNKSTIAKQQPDKGQSLQSLKWAMSNSGRAPTLSEINAMNSSAGPTSPVMGNAHLYQGQGQPQQYSSFSYGRAY
ncbi:hypothetical protein ACHAWO_004121 [Cyclotella atomus]|uniref:Uncharacterized protein n=1 Tax=Cyclotella atomus TaxID=382360 RepID=A0ABD3N9K1_9STRA